MTLIVEAPINEVQSVIAADPRLAPLYGAIEIRESALPPPKRSLEELPALVTIVDFLATALATNIAYDVGKRILFDALASHFGKERVSKVSKEKTSNTSTDHDAGP